MAARIGGGDRVEIVEHRLRIGAVVQQRGDHHRATAVGGQRFEKRHRRVSALGQHVDAATAVTHRGDERLHFAVVGQARRHRQPTLTVVRGRRAAGKADGARLHRLADDGLHLRDLGRGGGARRRVVAHHVGANAAMSDVGGDVDRAPFAPKLRHVFGECLEFPRNALPQYVQRHAFDLREIAHRDVAVLRLARRDGESAIADHRRRDAQRRRRPHTGVPRDLGVEVGVTVDNARHQRAAVGRDRGARGPARSLPIATMRPSVTATSMIAGALPVPSKTSASRKSRSCTMASRAGPRQCVMTTSTLQCARSINAGDVEPRHHRAAHPSRCLWPTTIRSASILRAYLVISVTDSPTTTSPVAL